MARIRSIKPEFFSDVMVAECSSSARLLFVGTWVFADDYGNLDRSALQLKMQVFPGDVELDVEKLLDSLMARLLLVEYSVSGKIYLHIPGFTKHQKIDRPSKPRFPPYADSLRTQRALDYSSMLKGREGSRVESSVPTSLRSVPGSSGGVLEEQTPTSLTPVEIPAEPEKVTARTWGSYSIAYRNRYQVLPVRNAKVNGQLTQLVKRLGVDEAPEVAAFYVGHQGQFYVRAKHTVDLLLRDAEGLRTEWARGRTVTSTEARQADETAARGNVFDKLIQEHRAGTFLPEGVKA